MMSRVRQPTALLLLILLGMYGLCGCSASISIFGPTYKVGGTVRGLSGTGLTLNGNAGIPANGMYPDYLGIAFVFGQTYDIAITAQPVNPSQTCVVSNGTGTITNADVSNVDITCTTNTYTVGGTVTGLLGSGLVLLDNASDSLNVVTNGTFTFATPVLSGRPYGVTISSQPTNPSQACSVANGTGIGTVTNADITTVAVVC